MKGVTGLNKDGTEFGSAKYRQTWKQVKVDIRHHGGTQGVEEEGDKGRKAGKGSAQTPAAGKEGSEPGQCLEEEGKQDEDPGKPPQVEVVVRGGVAAVAANQVLGGVVRVSIPRLAKGRCWARLAALPIVAAAEVEVGPLGKGPGAGDAGSVGLEEVGMPQGRYVCHARENDEPQEEKGTREQNDACRTQGGVCACSGQYLRDKGHGRDGRGRRTLEHGGGP